MLNATLLAFSNSAAEVFIILNSIIFGVSDIGISTVVQQSAFYQLVIQGIFYLIVAEDTLIDWWIMTRDTVLFLFYLSIMAYLLYGNKINKTKAIILMAVYVVHIILMKFSSKYEIIIKHNLANIMEIGELKKIATKDISTFHRTLRTEAISIEMLNKINFKFIDGYIVFEESQIKRKITPINIIKLGEEQFADKSDKALHARYNMKRAVSKIIIRLQAYKFNEQIIRNQLAKQHISEYVNNLDDEEENYSYCGESYYEESDSEKTL
jgi:Ca2+/Na+ antiporter